MGLVERISGFDSLREMEDARLDRYWDGLSCAIEGRFFGGSYLLGYAIEMALKVAYFRVLDVPETEDVRNELNRARAMARARSVRNLHGLVFWAETLVATREQRGAPMDPALAGTLIGYASDAAAHWTVAMRYRRSVPALEECHDLLRIADWVQRVHHQLWS